jgi:hypothetical protein
MFDVNAPNAGHCLLDSGDHLRGIEDRMLSSVTESSNANYEPIGSRVKGLHKASRQAR